MQVLTAFLAVFLLFLAINKFTCSKSIHYQKNKYYFF